MLRRLLPCLALVVCLSLGLAACGSSSESTTEPAPSVSTEPTTTTPELKAVKLPKVKTPKPNSKAVLTITYIGGANAKQKVWHLKCHPDGGNHPLAGQACAELRAQPSALNPTQPCAVTNAQKVPVSIVSGTWGKLNLYETFRPSCGSGWKLLNALLTGK